MIVVPENPYTAPTIKYYTATDTLILFIGY